jgi:multidrug efflux pump subunit AcrB
MAVHVVILGTALLGYMGIKSMRSSFFPLEKSKFVNITVVYPGASPEEMEEGIVLKIEENLNGMIGVERFTSTSMENSATIKVEAIKSYDIDVLLADVKNAVDKVPSFPADMEPPVVAKQETLTRGVSLALSGQDVPLRTLKTMGREIESELRATPGISQVTVSGFPAEEIGVEVSEAKLLAYNLTFRDVAAAVSRANILVTGGTVKTAEEDFLIRVSNRNYHASELAFVPVRTDLSGAIVRLDDVATLRDMWADSPNKSYYNARPSISVEVFFTNQEDLISGAGKVMKYAEEWSARQDRMSLHVTSDASLIIRQRTELLVKNGIQGVLLVIFFLSLFLRPRLAFWVAFGIPISFLGMFIFLNMLNVTINVLSLFGMIIVIGILVDDGIVIAENIYHHFEKGKSRLQAAIDGTMEVLPAITSAIITTIIAFCTFFFLDGRIGEFFPEVSIVVLLTLTFSLIEAFIILPAHVAHSKVLSPEQKTYWFNKRADAFLLWLRERVYMPAFRFFMKNKPIGFAIAIALFMITMGGLRGGVIKSTFFPVITSDRVNVNLRMPQGTNAAVTDSMMAFIERKVWEVNESLSERQTDNRQVIENVIRFVGPNSADGRLEINLLPGEERDFSSSEITAEISQACGPLPEAETVIFDSGSNFGGKPVSVSLLSYNISELQAAKKELKGLLAANPLLTNISDNDPAGIKEIKLKLKQEAVVQGFRLGDVIGQVRDGFNGVQAQRFQRGRDEIIVWVRYDESTRASLNHLEEMRIVSPSGNRVPLREIADYTIERGVIAINHIDGKREIKVEADLKNPKEGATTVVADIRQNLMPELYAKYPSLSALFEGQNREAQKVQGSAGRAIWPILILMFLVIAFTFRSLLKPLLLFIMVPFSMIGVGWGHWIHGFPINVLSFLGIIALIGIVVNDGLVLIGKLNSYLKEGMPFEEALEAAGRSRFRAIFLTSLTTVAGLSPLILEKSRQAQFLIPMAISIAYGIAIATVLTLIMLPMLLSLGNTAVRYVQWLWEGRKPTAESVETAVIELESETNDHE